MRDAIEAALGRWGIYVTKRPGWVILFVLVMTAMIGIQIRHFEIETSNEAFFYPDDPIRIQKIRGESGKGRV